MARPPRPCAKCPYWAHGWCALQGLRRNADAPSCEYGRKRMNAARRQAKKENER